MRVLKISKRDGTFRTVVAPSPEEKARMRSYIYHLQKIATARCPPGVVHGFWPGRSPVTNASFHVGYQYTVCFDLRNFFDTVTRDMVEETIQTTEVKFSTKPVLEDCFVDGIARQGLPTSPVIANIAAAPLDHQLEAWCYDRKISYTRYADDLSFSFHDVMLIEPLKVFVNAAVVQHSFEVNQKKTHVQCAKAGRRMITGVAVDDTLHPSRAAKRRLRSACHHGWRFEVNGMKEWIALKFPKEYVDDELKSRQKHAGINDNLF